MTEVVGNHDESLKFGEAQEPKLEVHQGNAIDQLLIKLKFTIIKCCSSIAWHI